MQKWEWCLKVSEKVKLKLKVVVYKSRSSFYKDEKCKNLITYSQAMLRIWERYFSTILLDDENGNSATREYEATRINNNGVDILSLSHNEIIDAIQWLENNKSAGHNKLHAELFNTKEDKLVRCMHWLIYRKHCHWLVPECYLSCP